MVSLAGLSNVYPGELAAEGASQQNDMRKLQLDQAQAEIAGKNALGKVFQQMVPGASPNMPPPPQQMAPQAPPPGQPSQPMQPPQRPPMAPPGPAAGGARGPQPGMPMGAPPGGAQAAGGPPGRGGGIPPGQGQFDLNTAAAAIARANPGIQPRILVEALSQALPYLNAEAKQQVAQMRQQMQGQLLDFKERSLDERAREADLRDAGRTADRTERGREADQRSADKRYGIDQIYKSKELAGQTKFEIAQLSVDAKREIADQVEGGKNYRAELSADTRRELLGMGLEARKQLTAYIEAQKAARLETTEAGKKARLDETEAGKKARLDETEAGKKARLDETITSREKLASEKLDFTERWAGVKREQHEQDRTSREDIAAANRASREGIAQKRMDLATARETRLAESSGARLRQQQATLEQRKKEAEARIARGDRTGQLAELMAVAKLQHNLDMEIINSYSFNSKLKPAERDKLIKEATQNRDTEIAQIQNMAKLGGGSSPPQGGDQPPVSALKEGMVTTFENGQKWTLRNGKPEKVQ